MTTEQLSPRALFWNRVQLLMMVIVFTAPVVGAFLYQPNSYSNYGDIYVPVRPVPNLVVYDQEQPFEMDSLRRQWLFLVMANGECDEACEDNILKIRQLRFMQNNDMTRIRTVFLHTNLATEVATDLTAKYRPMEVYRVNPEEYEAWFNLFKLEEAPKAANKDRVYIVDPAGNLMMSYPASADPSLMKKDIKRLLKTSQIG